MPLELDDIVDPKDLKSLSFEQLEALSSQIRTRIIDVLSKTGGHLASNLGVVELSLALHYVFNSPVDKLIFDVSHQAYVHKMLTGRISRFETIRQYKGLCGFTHPEESPHDHFYAGHAATALSLGLGVAKSREIVGEDFHVLPIIGDASLTCGLTLEALNNIPKDLSKFMIILNDNAMSISKNVGAITSILSRLINNPTANRIYQEIEDVISKIPGCGTTLAKQGHKVRESVKNLVSTAPFFEQYGLSYVGPIDGHDIRKLIDTLEALKDNPRPVLLHVVTVKGQGMSTAIDNPTTYHGAKPFDRTTGKFHPPSSIKPTFPKIFGKHLLEMADRNPNLITITPAMPRGSCLDAFMHKYPKRCLDVGIAEGHSVTFAGGIASNNKLNVVCSIYATFLQRAFDNVYHDVCLQNSPVVFAIDRGGIAGGDGVTHNGVYDISFLNAMPNMVITQPRNGQLLKELLEASFSWKRPTAIRYPNLPTEENDSPLKYRELGKAEVIVHGKELVLIALGHQIETALKVKEHLEKEEIHATVIDPIFVKPLDEELFKQVFQSHSMVVTIEEHSLQGGLGSILNSFILQNGFDDVQTLNFGIPDRFIEHGKHSELLEELELTPEKISKKILSNFLSEVKS